jgi:hypothetical protein
MGSWKGKCRPGNIQTLPRISVVTKDNTPSPPFSFRRSRDHSHARDNLECRYLITMLANVRLSEVYPGYCFSGLNRSWVMFVYTQDDIYPFSGRAYIWVNPTSAIFLFKDIAWGRTVGRTPSSHPFDFYSTIDLRCGLIYWTLTELARDYPQCRQHSSESIRKRS